MRNSVDSTWCPVVILVGLSIYLNCAPLSRHVEGEGGRGEREKRFDFRVEFITGTEFGTGEH